MKTNIFIRNQTTKVSIYSVDDINEYDWEPMPLIQGIKHVFSSNSCILKLPDYISLLETKFGSVCINNKF